MAQNYRDEEEEKKKGQGSGGSSSGSSGKGSGGSGKKATLADFSDPIWSYQAPKRTDTAEHRANPGAALFNPKQSAMTSARAYQYTRLMQGATASVYGTGGTRWRPRTAWNSGYGNGGTQQRGTGTTRNRNNGSGTGMGLTTRTGTGTGSAANDTPQNATQALAASKATTYGLQGVLGITEQPNVAGGGKWYAGDTPTDIEAAGRILALNGGDDMFAQLAEERANPESSFYRAYSQATSPALANLYALGVDVPASGLTDEWLDAAFIKARPYLKSSATSTTGAPSKPGKRASQEEKIAYWLWVAKNDQANTQSAEREMAALQEEIGYWANSPRGYSDEEVASHIDWSKYPTLRKMDENAANGVPTQLVRRVDWSRDYLSGMIWAARNGDSASGDAFTDSVYHRLGAGNGYTADETIRKKLDWTSQEYAPYSVGATGRNMEQAGMYFGTYTFDKDWLQRNRGYAESTNPETRQQYTAVYNAEQFTSACESEREALYASIDENMGHGIDPGTMIEMIYGEDSSDYKHLKELDTSMGSGMLRDTTRPIDYRRADVEAYIRAKYAARQAETPPTKKARETGNWFQRATDWVGEQWGNLTGGPANDAVAQYNADMAGQDSFGAGTLPTAPVPPGAQTAEPEDNRRALPAGMQGLPTVAPPGVTWQPGGETQDALDDAARANAAAAAPIIGAAGTPGEKRQTQYGDPTQGKAADDLGSLVTGGLPAGAGGQLSSDSLNQSINASEFLEHSGAIGKYEDVQQGIRDATQRLQELRDGRKSNAPQGEEETPEIGRTSRRNKGLGVVSMTLVASAGMSDVGSPVPRAGAPASPNADEMDTESRVTWLDRQIASAKVDGDSEYIESLMQLRSDYIEAMDWRADDPTTDAKMAVLDRAFRRFLNPGDSQYDPVVGSYRDRAIMQAAKLNPELAGASYEEARAWLDQEDARLAMTGQDHSACQDALTYFEEADLEGQLFALRIQEGQLKPEYDRSTEWMTQLARQYEQSETTWELTGDNGATSHVQAADVLNIMAQYANYRPYPYSDLGYYEELIERGDNTGKKYTPEETRIVAKEMIPKYQDLISGIDMVFAVCEQNGIEIPEDAARHMRDMRARFERGILESQDYDLRFNDDFKSTTDAAVARIAEEYDYKDSGLTEEDYLDYAVMQAATDHGISLSLQDTDNMTDDEARTLLYLMENGQTSNAQSYADLLLNEYGVVTTRTGMRTEQAMTQGLRDIDAATMNIGGTVATVAGHPLQGLGAIYVLGNALQGKTANPYHYLLSWGKASANERQIIKNEIAQAASAVWGENSWQTWLCGIGYDAVTSAGDSFMDGLATQALGLGSVFGEAAKGASVRTKVLYHIGNGTVAAMPMGLTAGTMAYIDAIGRGAEPSQAYALFGANALCESITEGIEIEAWKDAYKVAESMGLKAMAKEVLFSMANESVGEFANEFLEAFADDRIMGDFSNRQARINDLIAKGVKPDEAEAIYMSELFKQGLTAGLTGALSGGFSSTVTGAAGTIKYESSLASFRRSNAEYYQNIENFWHDAGYSRTAAHELARTQAEFDFQYRGEIAEAADSFETEPGDTRPAQVTPAENTPGERLTPEQMAAAPEAARMEEGAQPAEETPAAQPTADENAEAGAAAMAEIDAALNAGVETETPAAEPAPEQTETPAAEQTEQPAPAQRPAGITVVPAIGPDGNPNDRTGIVPGTAAAGQQLGIDVNGMVQRGAEASQARTDQVNEAVDAAVTAAEDAGQVESPDTPATPAEVTATAEQAGADEAADAEAANAEQAAAEAAAAQPEEPRTSPRQNEIDQMERAVPEGAATRPVGERRQEDPGNEYTGFAGGLTVNDLRALMKTASGTTRRALGEGQARGVTGLGNTWARLSALTEQSFEALGDYFQLRNRMDAGGQNGTSLINSALTYAAGAAAAEAQGDTSKARKLQRNYQKTLRILDRVLRQNGDSVGSHAWLTDRGAMSALSEGIAVGQLTAEKLRAMRARGEERARAGAGNLGAIPGQEQNSAIAPYGFNTDTPAQAGEGGTLYGPEIPQGLQRPAAPKTVPFMDSAVADFAPSQGIPLLRQSGATDAQQSAYGAYASLFDALPGGGQQLLFDTVNAFEQYTRRAAWLRERIAEREREARGADSSQKRLIETSIKGYQGELRDGKASYQQQLKALGQAMREAGVPTDTVPAFLRDGAANEALRGAMDLVNGAARQFNEARRAENAAAAAQYDADMAAYTAARAEGEGAARTAYQAGETYEGYDSGFAEQNSPVTSGNATDRTQENTGDDMKLTPEAAPETAMPAEEAPAEPAAAPETAPVQEEAPAPAEETAPAPEEAPVQEETPEEAPAETAEEAAAPEAETAGEAAPETPAAQPEPAAPVQRGPILPETNPVPTAETEDTRTDEDITNNPSNPFSQAAVNEREELDSLGAAAALLFNARNSGEVNQTTALYGVFKSQVQNPDAITNGGNQAAAMAMMSRYGGEKALATMRGVLLEAKRSGISMKDALHAIQVASLTDGKASEALGTIAGTQATADRVNRLMQAAAQDEQTYAEQMRQRVQDGMVARRVQELAGQGALSAVTPFVRAAQAANAKVSQANQNLAQATQRLTAAQQALIPAQQDYLGNPTDRTLEARFRQAQQAVEHARAVMDEYTQSQQNAAREAQQARDALNEARNSEMAKVRQQATADVQAELEQTNADREARRQAEEARENAKSGKSGQMYADGKTPVAFHYVLMDQAGLIASNDTDGRVNPEYPADLQPRDRTRMANRTDVDSIARSLTPALLGENPRTTDGAPVIGPDFVVESGNGRTMAIRQAMEQGLDSAKNYTSWLRENADKFGFNPEDITPSSVLVRMRDGEVDRRQFVQQSNQQTVSAMSQAETAQMDAGNLTSHILNLYNTEAPGILSKPNEEFVRAFMAMIPSSQQGLYSQANGQINSEGERRIENALFQAAYGSISLTNAIAENPNPEVKNVFNGLTNLAAKLAVYNRAVQDGTRYDLGIAEAITQAAEQYRRLKRDGESVQEYIGQVTMPGVDDTSDAAKLIMQMFEDNARSGKKITQYLTDLLEHAEILGDPSNTTMEKRAVPELTQFIRDSFAETEAQLEGTQRAMFNLDELDNIAKNSLDEYIARQGLQLTPEEYLQEFERWREEIQRQAQERQALTSDMNRRAENERKQDMRRFAQDFMNRFGIQIKFRDGSGRDGSGIVWDGAYVRGEHRVYIDSNMSDTQLFYSTLAHECMHSVEESGHYQQLQDILLSQWYGTNYEQFENNRRNGRMTEADMQLQADLQEIIDRYAPVWTRDGFAREYWEAEALHELTADHAIDMFQNEDMIRDFVQQDRSLAQRIHDWIVSAIQKLTGYNTEPLERARDLFARAIAEEAKKNAWRTRQAEAREAQQGTQEQRTHIQEINRPGDIRSLTEGRVPTDYSSDADASSAASSGTTETVPRTDSDVKPRDQYSLRQDTRPGWLRVQQDSTVHRPARQFSVVQGTEAAGYHIELASDSGHLFNITYTDSQGNERTAEMPFRVYDDNGNTITECTPEMLEHSPMGRLIQAAIRVGTLDANQTVDYTTRDANGNKVTEQVSYPEALKRGFSNLMTLAWRYGDGGDMVWEIASAVMFSSMKNNSDAQYSTTIDFGTVCTKTQAIVDLLSQRMKEKGRGLSRQEVLDVYNEAAKEKLDVPCPVCYVFSRWMGVPSLLGRIAKYQQNFGSMTQEQVDDYVRRIQEKYKDTNPDPSKRKTLSQVLSASKTKLGNQLDALADEGRKTTDQAKRQQIARTQDMLEAEYDEIDAYNWVTQVLCKKQGDRYVLDKSYRPVPNEVLFDLNRSGRFATDYPKTWRYRNTRGAGMGKSILEYGGFQFGDTIRPRGKDAQKRWTNSQNPIFNGKDYLTDKYLRSARTKAKAQNLIGGQRYQSTSDFRPEWGLDYYMSLMENQITESKVQLYTKVIEAVDMFARANCECNLSLMGKDTGYHEATEAEIADAQAQLDAWQRAKEAAEREGNPRPPAPQLDTVQLEDGRWLTLDFSDVNGIDPIKAKQKIAQYDNVQGILVGMNRDHILAAMASKWIQFIIPWHSSGNSAAVLSQMLKSVNESLNPEDASDWTDQQTDKPLEKRTQAQIDAWNVRMDLLTGKLWEGGKPAPTAEQMAVIEANPYLRELYRRFYLDESETDTYGVRLNAKQAGQIFPYEYWDTSTTIDTADVNGQRFVEYCETLGMQPRFQMFSGYTGYWKLLIDRCMYNNDGTYHTPKTIDVTQVRTEDVATSVSRHSYGDQARYDRVQAALDAQERARAEEAADNAKALVQPEGDSFMESVQAANEETFGGETVENPEAPDPIGPAAQYSIPSNMDEVRRQQVRSALDDHVARRTRGEETLRREAEAREAGLRVEDTLSMEPPRARADLRPGTLATHLFDRTHPLFQMTRAAMQEQQRTIDELKAKRKAGEKLTAGERAIIRSGVQGYDSSRDVRDLVLAKDNAIANSTEFVLTRHMVDSRGNRVYSDDGSQVGSLADILQKVNQRDEKAFNAYWLALYMKERQAAGREVTRDLTDTAEMDRTIAEAEAAHPDWRGIVDQACGWYGQFMQTWLVNEGLVRQSTLDTFRQMYPHYVPTFSAELTESAAQKRNRGRQRAQHLSRAGEGAGSILNPVMGMAEKVQTMIATAKQAEVMRAFGDFFSSDAGRNMGLTEELDPTPAKEEHGAGIGAMEAMSTFEWVTQDPQTKRDILHVPQADGTVRNFVCHDPGIIKALVGTQQNGKGIQAVARLTGFMCSLATAKNLAFSVQNFLSDGATAMITGNTHGNALTYNIQRLASMFDLGVQHARDAMGMKTSERYQQYQLYGGMGSRYAMRETDVSRAFRDKLYHKDVNALRGFAEFVGSVLRFEHVEALSNLLEETTRYNEFIHGHHDLTSYEGLLKAAKASREVTTDFSKSGDWDAVRYAGQLVPFIRAQLQGTYKSMRMFSSENAGNRGRYMRRIVFNTLISAAVLAALRGIDWDDDELKAYEEMAPYERVKYAHVKLGGKILRIKRTQDGVLGFANAVGDMIGDLTNGYEDNDFAQFADAVHEIAKNMLPSHDTVFEPFLDASNNQTWYGSPIEGSQFDGMAEQDKYTSDTWPVYRWASNLSNMIGIEYSPLDWQYIAQQYTGSAGRIYAGLGQQLMNGDFSLEDAIGMAGDEVFGRMTYDPVYSSYASSTFYDGLDALAGIKATNDQIGQPGHLLRADITPAEHQMALREIDTMTKKGGSLYMIKKSLKSLWKQYNAIGTDGLMSDEEAEEARRNVRRQINEQARRGNAIISGFMARYGRKNLRQQTADRMLRLIDGE